MSTKETRSAPGFSARDASKFFFRGGHTGWLGLIFSDQGDNWVELELPWREDLLGEADREVLASGPIVSLMDMASGMSIWQTKQSFIPVATLDLRVDYQRPARERSAVWGRVECYRTTRSAAFVRGIAHDGDINDPVAHVAGVFMTISNDPRQGNVPVNPASSTSSTDDE
ncbi:hotdog domain-containing protein [Erythrobacter sp. Alg231-14]|uniref:hotdog domain-containing protein n=1 Tax=Erythrobacter sp. Alg231-14 TaxID=1922225 RepID=UPI000D5587F5